MSMSPKEVLLQIAENHWSKINIGSQITPDSLLLSLTSDPNHRFDTLHLEDATGISHSFLVEMEKYKCVKKHTNFTKRCPIYIKTSNNKNRAVYRKFCDIINSFEQSYRFTSTEFINIINDQIDPDYDKKRVSTFLSKAANAGFLLKTEIEDPGWHGDKIEYIKELCIPETEMRKMTTSYEKKRKVEAARADKADEFDTVSNRISASVQKIKDKDASAEMATSYDIFEVLKGLKAENIKLKEDLQKANKDAIMCAKREAEARDQAQKYQEELNFFKQQTGANISKEQLDKFR